MKFTKKIVENVFKNLCKTPESIHEFNDGTSFDVDLEDEWGDSLRVIINSNNNNNNNNNNRVEFSSTLDYKQTFDKEDIKFFDSINVTSWEIYKHWITFGVDVRDGKELGDVTRKVMDRYFD